MKEIFNAICSLLSSNYNIEFIDIFSKYHGENNTETILTNKMFRESTHDLNDIINDLIIDYKDETEDLKETYFPSYLNNESALFKYFILNDICTRLVVSYNVNKQEYIISLDTNVKKKEEFCKFETGAVRSADCNQLQYSLISPKGLAHLAKIANQITFNNTHPTICLNKALVYKYNFLSGDKCVEQFAYSALCICYAIKNKDLTRWVNNINYTNTQSELRFDLIPYEAMKALAQRYALGSSKYGYYNWEKGFSILSLQDHSIEHILKYLSGDRSDDHLAGALWGDIASIHSWLIWRELNKLLRDKDHKLNKDIEDYLDKFHKEKHAISINR